MVDILYDLTLAQRACDEIGKKRPETSLHIYDKYKLDLARYLRFKFSRLGDPEENAHRFFWQTVIYKKTICNYRAKRGKKTPRKRASLKTWLQVSLRYWCLDRVNEIRYHKDIATVPVAENEQDSSCGVDYGELLESPAAMADLKKEGCGLLEAFFENCLRGIADKSVYIPELTALFLEIMKGDGELDTKIRRIVDSTNDLMLPEFPEFQEKNNSGDATNSVLKCYETSFKELLDIYRDIFERFDNALTDLIESQVLDRLSRSNPLQYLIYRKSCQGISRTDIARELLENEGVSPDCVEDYDDRFRKKYQNVRAGFSRFARKLEGEVGEQKRIWLEENNISPGCES